MHIQFWRSDTIENSEGDISQSLYFLYTNIPSRNFSVNTVQWQYFNEAASRKPHKWPRYVYWEDENVAEMWSTFWQSYPTMEN